MTIETQSALESGAMESFTKLLGHKTATIRGKAARDVMDLRYIVKHEVSEQCLDNKKILSLICHVHAFKCTV